MSKTASSLWKSSLDGLASSHVSRLTLSGAPKIHLYCTEYRRPMTRTPSIVPIGTKITRRYLQEKKNQYLCLCLEMRKDFTPLVYSVDGIAGREAKNAEKHLAYHLSEKSHKPLPQMVYYVQFRMSIAVVRANSLLIHGSRDRQRPCHPVIFNQHAMNDWRTWLEQ
jgi:hypothetical protein